MNLRINIVSLRYWGSWSLLLHNLLLLRVSIRSYLRRKVTRVLLLRKPVWIWLLRKRIYVWLGVIRNFLLQLFIFLRLFLILRNLVRLILHCWIWLLTLNIILNRIFLELFPCLNNFNSFFYIRSVLLLSKFFPKRGKLFNFLLLVLIRDFMIGIWNQSFWFFRNWRIIDFCIDFIRMVFLNAVNKSSFLIGLKTIKF